MSILPNVNFNRNIKIDAIKGSMIILVVFRHSIQRCMSNYSSNVFFNLIGSFHMELFMIISGFVIYNKLPQKLESQWLIKKFKLLIIPFFSWCVISYFYNTYVISDRFFLKSPSFLQYVLDVFLNPYYGKWYIWVLFFIYILICLLGYIKRYQELVLLGATLVLLYTMHVLPDIFGFSLISQYFPFFIVGFLISKYKQRIISHFSVAAAVSFIVFVPLYLLLGNYESDFFSLRLHDLFGINYGIKFLILRNSYYYLTAICLSIVVSWIFTKLPQHFLTPFARLGLITLDIYLVHGLFLNFKIGNGYFAVIFVFILTMLFSVLITYIIKFFPLVSQILLGHKR